MHALVAHDTTLEETIAARFAQALGVPRFGPDDDFFTRGGDQLLFTRVVAGLLRAHGVALPVSATRASTTPRGLATLIQACLGDGRPDPAEVAQLAHLAADADLTTQFCISDQPVADAHRPARVLLTGATGYVGSFLLHELLLRTEARVHCLVRAEHEAAAMRRLELVGQEHGWTQPWRDRVVAEVGDLRRPGLGLSAQRLDELAATVDAIYHAGAEVNFVHPYRALRAANVDATRELIRLACRQRVAALHHLSTVTTSGARGVVREDDPLPIQPSATGYLQSKWVAEKLVRAAAERGLPARIYRPSLTLGHTSTGAVQTSEFACLMLKGCVQLGAAPEHGPPLSFVPVDYLCRAIVHLSLLPAPTGRCYQLVNHAPAELAQVWDWLAEYGYRLALVPPREWLRRVRAAGDGCALYPVAPLLAAELAAPAGGLGAPGAIDSTNTDAALAGTGIDCPPVSKELLWLMLDYLVRVGYLPPPARQAAADPVKHVV